MHTLPDDEKSLWRMAYTADHLYPKLATDIVVDVAVIGAGITGLTTAYLLKQSGLHVVVLEKHTVGGGTTGRTTGKVTSQHNLIYDKLAKRHSTETARLYGQANQAGLDKISAIIKAERIRCDWRRDDNYVYTADTEKVAAFRQEAKVAKDLGLPASFEASTPLPFDVTAAVKFSNQAKIHAQKYILGLAQAVHGQGSYVFERSAALSIRDGTTSRVRTQHGIVTAKHIVIATSVPTFPLLARGAYSLYEYPVESYIVAGEPKNYDLTGMYISPDKQHYSILPTKVDGQHMLLVGGESHFWGLRGNRYAHFERLAAYAEEHFGVIIGDNRWSDRDYLSYDHIPLVGKLYPWSKNLYVGTAFQKWGLTNGTAAAIMLHDQIIGKPNPWAATFRTHRILHG